MKTLTFRVEFPNVELFRCGALEAKEPVRLCQQFGTFPGRLETLTVRYPVRLRYVVKGNQLSTLINN